MHLRALLKAHSTKWGVQKGGRREATTLQRGRTADKTGGKKRGGGGHTVVQATSAAPALRPPSEIISFQWVARTKFLWQRRVAGDGDG